MSFLSKFEGRMEDTVEGAASKMAGAPLSPVQIAKKAEKQMRREKMVGAGKQYAPTLYTVLVSPDDDERLFAYYPTLAGETETYLAAKAAEQGLVMDGHPLVRFIVDEGLKHGKFDVIAEMVASPLVAQLREEEMDRYGIASPSMPAPRSNMVPIPSGSRPANQGGYANQGYQPLVAPAAPVAPPQPNAYQGYPNQDFVAPGGTDYNAMPNAGFDQGIYDDRGYDPAPYAAPVAPQAPVAPTPTPAPVQREAKLIDPSNNRTYSVSLGNTTIGRETGNDIVISDINASRNHAEIHYEQPGVWVLSDSGSMNGTSINGRQIKSQALRNGDRITIGTTDLTFLVS